MGWYGTIALTMRKRRFQLVWLATAVLFAIQSLTPVAAMAEVSMRCAGAMASGVPCVRATVLTSGVSGTVARFKAMPCCRNMAGCQKALARQLSITRSSFTDISSPTCVISVNTLASREALTPSMHRWLLQNAPAQAPPTRRAIVAPIETASTKSYFTSNNFPTPFLIRAHGLRAPPCA